MITLNGSKVEIGSFPDGSILMKREIGAYESSQTQYIRWCYENDREFLALIYLVKHLRQHGCFRFELYMPYIPNARQDRIKRSEDVFTLKYFAELLNDLKLDSITVLDPHSSVSEAVINNLRVITPETYIDRALLDLKYNKDVNIVDIVAFYPDSGAATRYSTMVNRRFAYGIKNRNWETGKIEGLDVIDNGLDLNGKDILIVDDICSRGGTFYHSAKKLKELGAKDIYLYVSHCENTILEGDLLDGDLIKKVYTTDSIFTKSHEKIEVLK